MEVQAMQYKKLFKRLMKEAIIDLKEYDYLGPRVGYNHFLWDSHSPTFAIQLKKIVTIWNKTERTEAIVLDEMVK
jgi:hypothetical protein